MALVEKRARSPTGDAEGALIENKKAKSDAISVGAVPRTSTMQSPIMVLTGHGGEVLVSPPLLVVWRVRDARRAWFTSPGAADRVGSKTLGRLCRAPCCPARVWSARFSSCARRCSLRTSLTTCHGHGQVLSFKFDPSGKYCASAGHDKDIFLWEVSCGPVMVPCYVLVAPASHHALGCHVAEIDCPDIGARGVPELQRSPRAQTGSPAIAVVMRQHEYMVLLC